MIFFKFILAGGSGAVANIISRYLLNLFMPFSIAIVLAYVIGMITTFTLSKLFVFESKSQNSTGELIRFTIVNIFALLIVWIVSIVFARIIFPSIGFAVYPNDLAHIIGVCSTAIFSYFGHKFFTFT
mgnify:FL=1